MTDEKIKVYLYSRVSTEIQVDGYSLEAQDNKMKTFCQLNEYEVAGRYEDAGKSGKSILGRPSFLRMIDDIKAGKDDVKYVIVFKLSRFGRNAADILSTLQEMQDYGVNLICIEDGIDSSKEAGKLMISVLAAVAEIERENIRVQTMEGRMQKAREGKWNGGFAPYGYKLVDGKLYINEEEAKAIRMIYDLYINTNMGCNGIAKHLEEYGVSKIIRHNGKSPKFSASLLRKLIQNPIYCGDIAFGRRKTEKIHGTRNEYHLVKSDDYICVKGEHEPIVSKEVWELAQKKVKVQAKKYEKVNRKQGEKIHLISGILKCPECGAPMYGNKTSKRKSDGSLYKDYYFYGCKNRGSTKGYVCTYRKQVNEETLNQAVVEVIRKLVHNPRFTKVIKKQINIEIDTKSVDEEVKVLEKQLKQYFNNRDSILVDLDNLDIEDKHYNRRKQDLDNRLYKNYDKIEDVEDLLLEARSKKKAMLEEKTTGDNIFKSLLFFDEYYEQMSDREKREFLCVLIKEIHIYPEKKPNGRLLERIVFKLSLLNELVDFGLDNENSLESVVLMSEVK